MGRVRRFEMSDRRMVEVDGGVKGHDSISENGIDI